MKPEPLGFSPFTIELAAIAALVAAAIFGFRRIEQNIGLLWQTHQRLEWEENLTSLVNNFRGNPLRTNLGEVLTPEQVEARAAAALRDRKDGRASGNVSESIGSKLPSSERMPSRRVPSCGCGACEPSVLVSELESPNCFARAAPPNFTLKLVRPGFGPAAELPTSSPA
jgi:hypothetical protein